jgi:hypothetical protein
MVPDRVSEVTSAWVDGAVGSGDGLGDGLALG